MFFLFLFSALVAALPAVDKADSLILLPLFYTYGGYPKISTNIFYGTPAQKKSISAVVDLGSANYWVDGPNATVNSGNTSLGALGPCNQTVHPFFNWPKSNTSTKPVNKTSGYSYGGNGKLISTYYTVNDTISFGNKNYPSLTNQRVAIANFTLLKQAATTCDGADYDKSILGLSKYIETKKSGKQPLEQATTGPSFRQDLLDTGAIKSSSFSMWFDALKGPANGTFKGTALFGAVPKSKFSGDLVSVAPLPPKDTYVGYYVGIPVFKTASLKHPKVKKTLKLASKPPKQCLIDSGTGQDNLPVSEKDFLQITGLIKLQSGFIAYNGTCDSIPHSASLDYTFTGLNKKNVTVKVPLRNYARGNTDYLNRTHPVCGMSLGLDEPGSCTLGAPFSTAVFLAIDDETNEIAIAQGGVSKGAEKGVNGLGEITVVQKGDKLPYTS